jgi:hypothetical protein
MVHADLDTVLNEETNPYCTIVVSAKDVHIKVRREMLR